MTASVVIAAASLAVAAVLVFAIYLADANERLNHALSMLDHEEHP